MSSSPTPPRLRLLVAAVALSLSGLIAAPSGAIAAPLAVHSCTKTSSGNCIKGGQFCPQSSYGKSGWDAQGRRYVCKGDHDHPHWMKP